MEVDCPARLRTSAAAGRRRGRSGSRRVEIEAGSSVVFFSLVVQVSSSILRRRGDDVAMPDLTRNSTTPRRKRPDDEGIAHALDRPRSNLSGRRIVGGPAPGPGPLDRGGEIRQAAGWQWT